MLGANGITATGYDRPALADGIDLAFVIFCRAQRRAIVEPGPPIPAAVPGIGLDIVTQQFRLLAANIRKGLVVA